MFERFTDRARVAMALANQHAQRLNHAKIDTVHILLGLVERDGGMAVEVLTALGVTRHAVRSEIERRIKPGPEMASMGRMPMKPAAEKVCERAIDEARRFNRDYVGTEHLLLALQREQDDTAAQVLASLGLTAQQTAEQIAVLIGHVDDAESLPRRFGPTSHHPCSDQAQALLQRAREEAARVDMREVAPLHILLAMLRDNGSDAARILADAGIDEQQVARALRDSTTNDPAN